MARCPPLILLFYSFVISLSNAGRAQFNPENPSDCLYPSSCNFNDPQIWIYDSNFTSSSNCTYTIYNGQNQTLVLDSTGTDIFQLIISGDTLLKVNGEFFVEDSVYLYDTATILVSGTESSFTTANISIQDLSTLQIAYSGSVQAYNIEGDAGSTILMSGGTLFADFINIGSLECNETSLVQNFTNDFTTIDTNCLKLSGSPSILANVTVGVYAALAGTFTITDLLLGGSISLTINSNCPNIESLTVFESAEVTISAMTNCNISSVRVCDEGDLMVKGGSSWFMSKVQVVDNGYLSFRQGSLGSVTDVTILKGQGNLDFQGSYETYLGQSSAYVPAVPETNQGRFVLNELTHSYGLFEMVSNGVILNQTFADYNTRLTVPVGKSVAITTEFNVSDPQFSWSAGSSLLVRDNASIHAPSLTLTDQRSLVLQTPSISLTNPNIVVNWLNVTNATLRAEYNGVIRGDVFIQGFLDLSFTLTRGTLTIDGDLKLSEGSNITINTNFHSPTTRGMSVHVTGDVILDGNMVFIVTGGAPADYGATGLTQAILTCDGILSGSFDSYNYSLSSLLSVNSSMYIVSPRVDNNTLYVKMLPTPRPLQPVPDIKGPKSGISTAALIGIVVGGVVLVAFVIGFLINGWFFSKKTSSKVKVTATEKLACSNDNVPYAA